MNKVNTLCAAALLLASFQLSAQVQFKMDYNKDSERYTVSVVPMATYQNQQNITGTGQVTIKVPSNNFDPVDIVNHLDGMYWEANSRNNSPAEAPSQDYISFGLTIQGIAYPNYQEGVELPLFSFQNAFGCTGEVALVDNFTDPFMPPNSQSANIGNTLTILGAGGDAYGGIIGSAIINCDESAVLDAKEEIGLNSYRIFPNPASEFVSVEVTWEGAASDATIQIVDALGREVMASPVSLVSGKMTQKLQVNELASGNYFVNLKGEDWKLGLDRFTKQ